jgi:hypothetical protein
MSSVISSNPALTYTISDFISMKYTDEITFRNYSILEVINDIELLDHNLVEDYLSELSSICVSVPLTDEEYKKYKYAPDLLAYDVYGSVQLDFVIMYANNIIDPKEFNFKTIKLPYASALKTFLASVYNVNSGYLEQNREDNNIINY